MSSENYLIILKQLENLISSIDESPAHISNKLARVRQRHFYPSNHLKCISGHFAKFKQRQKKAHLYVFSYSGGTHIDLGQFSTPVQIATGFSAGTLFCTGSRGGPQLNLFQVIPSSPAASELGKDPLSPLKSQKNNYYRSNFTFLSAPSVSRSQVAPCRQLMQRTCVTSRITQCVSSRKGPFLLPSRWHTLRLRSSLPSHSPFSLWLRSCQQLKLIKMRNLKSICICLCNCKSACLALAVAFRPGGCFIWQLFFASYTARDALALN